MALDVYLCILTIHTMASWLLLSKWTLPLSVIGDQCNCPAARTQKNERPLYTHSTHTEKENQSLFYEVLSGGKKIIMELMYFMWHMHLHCYCKYPPLAFISFIEWVWNCSFCVWLIELWYWFLIMNRKNHCHAYTYKY